ncbi:unnamed protein product [Protopolystoma xenopodis]|uniref:Uncharacterized protein n=1 Tax=Protopolystoma xenopodis TaxID=117903 RepID=A0A448WF72_9PLAT|nr:unnamed protein product [Protopolystoma xenopodis]
MRVVHAQAYRREGLRPGVGLSRDVIGRDCGQLWAIVVTDEPIRKKAMSSQRADWRESLVSSLFHALPCSRGPGCPTSREVDLPRLFDELFRLPLLQRLGSGGKTRRHVVKVKLITPAHFSPHFSPPCTLTCPFTCPLTVTPTSPLTCPLACRPILLLVCQP